MTDFGGALTDLQQAIEGAQPTLIPPGAPEPAGPFDALLADLKRAQQPAPTQPSFTMAQPGQAPPQTSTAGALFNSAADSALAAAQGTSPQVGRLGGGGNYQLAPQAEQDFFAEQGHPRGTPDNRHIVLRDPGTGQLAIYLRNPEMNQDFGGMAGRMLAYGVPETGIPAVGLAARPSASQALLQDFTQAGVPPSIPAVGQGIGSRLATNIVSKVPIIGGPVNAAAGRAVAGAGAAAERLAGMFGDAAGPEAAGASVQQGIRQFTTDAPAGSAAAAMTPEQLIAAPTRASSFPDKSGALFDRFWDQIDQTAPVSVEHTLASLHGPVERFPSNADLGAKLTNPTLQSYYESLAPGEKNIPAVYSSILDPGGNPILLQAAAKAQTGGSLTLGELRELRSDIGRRLGDPMLISDIPRSDLNKVYAGISRDLENAAAAAGPDALRAFQRANTYYKAGIERINQLEPLLKGSPEQTFAAINRAASAGPAADAGQLRSLQRSMSPEQWGDVGAAVIRRMGEPTAGQKSVLEGAPQFSASSFVTNWNKLSDSAKDTLFGADTPGSHRESLEALARVADAQKQILRFANPSGTGAHTIGAIGVGAIGDHFLDLTSHPITTVLGGLSAYGASKFLMSPTAARWLIGTPPTVAAAPSYQVGMQRALSQLDQLARIDPSMAGYAQSIRAAMPSGAQPPQ